MGGTEPSSRPAGRLSGSRGAFLCFFLAFGWGEEIRGVGGFEVWTVCWRVMASDEAGGVGIGLFEVAEFFASEADEPWRGRLGREDVADEGMPPARMVGEAVCVLGYLGRWVCSGALLVPPGDGRGGSCPVLSTAIECGAWDSGMRASCVLELMAWPRHWAA
jgi:hypothetical protein